MLWILNTRRPDQPETALIRPIWAESLTDAIAKTAAIVGERWRGFTLTKLS